MWPFKSKRHAYQAVASEDVEVKDVGSKEIETQDEAEQPTHPNKHTRRTRLIAAATCLALFLTLFASIILLSSKLTPHLTSPTPPQPKPPLRHEWRTLPPSTQKAYITAVLCLRTHPSTLHPHTNSTLYDDFPWIHSRIGYYTHGAAAFLPWHRYFLHVYETTLRERCGYQDGLVYWDWTLDWEALETAPVFDAETGFGGDGEVGGAITVSRTGRCVVDGPFAGVVAEFYDVQRQPHCLSRGFRDLEGKLGHIYGEDVRPERIEEVLSLPDYEGFVAEMERRVHDAIPYGISGDFETFTAPYDPLFFLHHVQLDRLWWLWQVRQEGGGLVAYGGHRGRHSIEMAGLGDRIVVGGLGPDVEVREVMDIHGGMLWYDYEG